MLKIKFKTEGGGNLHYEGGYEIEGLDNETEEIMQHIKYETLALAYDHEKNIGSQLEEKGNIIKIETDKEELEELISEVSYENYWEQAKEKVRRKKRKKEIIKKAKETGKKQFLHSYREDCNDPSAQCDIDLVNVYINKDGEKEEKRMHTY